MTLYCPNCGHQNTLAGQVVLGLLTVCYFCLVTLWVPLSAEALWLERFKRNDQDTYILVVPSIIETQTRRLEEVRVAMIEQLDLFAEACADRLLLAFSGRVR